MDAVNMFSFDGAKLQKLADMFKSAYRDQAETLLDLALAQLKEDQSRICLQFSEMEYGKERFLECALLRDDLKQAFESYAENEISTAEIQNIIFRAIERTSEIAQEAAASVTSADTGHVPAGETNPPASSLFSDFHVPERPAPAPPVDGPTGLEAVPAPSTPFLSERTRKVGRGLFWIGFSGLTWFSAKYGEYDAQATWPVFVVSAFIGCVLLLVLRKLLPIFGWFGLLLKTALVIDSLFVCYLVGFHESPFNAMRGGPFPTLRQPVYPVIIACVLASGAIIMPEVMEWFQQKASRLRFAFFTAVVLIVISVLAIRNPIPQPLECNNPKNWTGVQCDDFLRKTKPPFPVAYCDPEHMSAECQHYMSVLGPDCNDPKYALNSACNKYSTH